MVNEDINKEEFLVYVSFHAAYADLRLTPDEKEQIRLKYGDAAFFKVKDIYESQTEYENLKTFSRLKELYYPGEEGTGLILKHMMDTFNADGNYSQLEKTSYSFLSRFLK